ncbi:TetR/AcrR family transcriptional regulator [Alloyangia pacifica]|uniref:Transcriptional regulator, TetR family n=1 Tax=Alloyangia pacifica TaxID=311180 RepID=A0A1I6NSK6_9RHOB|nr:TetR/AcrR family transcriptional regulator [Alloyangia pacifica]SDH63117.1 transcriptional regulator, TetR family [Alloyangia pacifica]SFS30891.1 transcriptional regulator, TetR family [Alloyangia pacifica]
MARTAGSHSDITGPRIREAALRLFAKHGYAAVSMRRIASEVGVQAGALYNYIPDKQALLFSLLKGHMDELLETWEATPQPADPLARLEAFVRFHIRFTLRRAESIFISYMELRNLEPENFVQIEALRGRYEGMLEQILRDGQAAGQLSVPDTRIAAFALIGMLTGVNTWYREGGRLSEEEVAALYWDMARKAVGAG